MTTSQWLGAGSLIVIIVFVVFAFRQGMNVKRDDRPDSGSGFGGHGLG
jgi:hypothetical protein